MEVDAAARIANQRRLRALAGQQSDAIRIFCAHDLTEFERLSLQERLTSHPALATLLGNL
jgi:hypothetical protein